MNRPVYLDYAATTPVDPRVAEQMSAHLTPDGIFGNPASRSHVYGWEAEEAVEAARVALADLIGSDPREIVWTSGATESDNLAIKGAMAANLDRGRHLVTSVIEHKAVIDTCRWLETRGCEVTWLEPDRQGLVTPEAVADALRDDTVLVSLMHVNNELGVINDIAAIGRITRAAGVLLHVDAAQSLAKMPVDVTDLHVDLMAFSGHKIYGPKGIGALYVRRSPEVRIEAQIHGGGHERGMRSGTLPTHQIVGLGRACAIAADELAQEAGRLQALRDRLQHGLAALGGVHLNGHPERRVPGILSLAFEGVDGEALLMAVAADVACSSGSACNSTTVEPSYVLRGIGLEDALAHATIRFSVGRFSDEAEVDLAIERVGEAVRRLRAAGGQTG